MHSRQELKLLRYHARPKRNILLQYMKGGKSKLQIQLDPGFVVDQVMVSLHPSVLLFPELTSHTSTKWEQQGKHLGGSSSLLLACCLPKAGFVHDNIRPSSFVESVYRSKLK